MIHRLQEEREREKENDLEAGGAGGAAVGLEGGALLLAKGLGGSIHEVPLNWCIVWYMCLLRFLI